MKRDAEAHSADDKKKREVIEIKNQADGLAYMAEKALRDGGDKVPADIRAEVEGKIEELKKIKDGEDVEAIKAKIEDLSRTMSKIGEAIYKDPQASSQGGQAGNSSPEGDKSGIDAEYEDVKKEEPPEAKNN